MKKVLIVEDSPTQAARLRHFLGSRYQVVHAERASIALDMARAEIPDILVTDVAMPEMDGFELCKRFKSNSKLSGVPVLLLTGLSEPEDIIWGLEAGADSYLTKPYDDQELLSRIAFVLDSASRQDPENEPTEPLEINFLEKSYTVKSSRRQILGLLLSTYESAARINKRLNKEKLELRLEAKQLKYDAEDGHSQALFMAENWPGMVVVQSETGEPIWLNERARDLGDFPATLYEMDQFLGHRLHTTETTWDGETAYLVCGLKD